MKTEQRIKKGSQIETVIKARKSVGNKYFVVYKYKNHEYDHYRFAVSVSKKFGNAVARNKIKRQVREIVWKNNMVCYDVFIVIKPTANKLRFFEMKQHLEMLFRKNQLLEVNE